MFNTDKPDFKKRLQSSMFLSGTFAFTFIIFGFLDLYINNLGLYPFGFLSLLVPTLIMALILFAAMTLLLSALRGKAYYIVYSVIFGILIAGYLQGNFLNFNLGELTGDPVDWSRYSGIALINAVTWLILVIFPVIIFLFRFDIWKKIATFIPILVITMQAVSLITVSISSELPDYMLRGKKGDLILTTEGIFDVSADKNAIVFIVDRMDGKYIDQVFDEDPDFFNDLNGFTYYPDNTAKYCRTYPAVVNMLTGHITRYEKPAGKFFKESYADSPFIKTLRENGYTTKTYIDNYYAYTDVAQLLPIADNIYSGESVTKIHYAEIGYTMSVFASYRYAPQVLKPAFWFNPKIFDRTVESVINSQYEEYKADDFKFFGELKNRGVAVNENKNNFMYIHLNGCHSNDMDQNGNPMPEGQYSTISHQTMGVFTIIKEYLNQLKDLGLYDDAMIIITGDHGKSEDWQSLATYKTTGLFVKTPGSGDGFSISETGVSHDNFQASVLAGLGLDYKEFGTPYWEVNETPKRTLFFKGNAEGRAWLEEYEITGDARDFNNWHMVKEQPVKYDH